MTHAADIDAVVAAARSLLRTASRPTSGSATAQVNATALDRLRVAVRDIPPGEGCPSGWHGPWKDGACVDCGAPDARVTPPVVP